MYTVDMDFDALPQISREAVASLEDNALEQSFLSPSIDLKQLQEEDDWENDNLSSPSKDGESVVSTPSSPRLCSDAEDFSGDEISESDSERGVDSDEEEEEDEFEDLDKTVAVQFKTPRAPLSWPDQTIHQQTPTPNNYFADAFFGTPLAAPRPFAFTPRNPYTPNLQQDTTTFHTIPTAVLTERHENITTIDFNLFRSQLVKQGDIIELQNENSLVESQLATEGRNVRKLEDALADELLAFSPEKRRKSNSGSPAVSSMTPSEQTPERIKVIKPRIRNTPRRPVSPAKTSIASLLEQVASTVSFDAPVPMTREERKAERRRRETRELRQFSEIDLSALTKLKMRPAVDAVVEEQEEDEEGNDISAKPVADKTSGAVEDSSEKAEEIEVDCKTKEVEEAVAIAEDMVPSSAQGTSVEEKKEELSKNGSETIESAVSKRPKATIDLTRPRRISMPTLPRYRRSSSVPLNPHEARGSDALPALDRLRSESASIPHLQTRIEELEGKLDEITMALQIATTALHAERRARIDAESTREFLELERQFGVCCAHRRFEEQETKAASSVQKTTIRPPTSSLNFEVTGIRKVETEDAPKRHGEPRKLTAAPSQPQRPTRGAAAPPLTSSTTLAPSVKEKRVLSQNTGNVPMNTSRSGVIRTKGSVSQTQKAHPYATTGPVRMRRMENTTGAKGPRR